MSKQSVEHHKVAIIGTGFGGLCAGARLVEAGIDPTSIRIVDKADTSVLQDTREQTVTLVTCYPFYYVGPAPRRFVVTARLASNYVNRD